MRFHVDCRPQIRIVHWKSQCSQGGSQGGFQKGTMFWMSLCFSLTWDSMSRNGQRQGFMVAWLCIAARSPQKKLPLGSPVKNRLSAILVYHTRGYPGYQRFSLAYDEELRRSATGRHVFGRGEGRRHERLSREKNLCETSCENYQWAGPSVKEHCRKYLTFTFTDKRHFGEN